MENWVTIEEFPQYSVSDRGQVRNDITGRMMVLSANQLGIVYVGLMADGFQYKRSVAKLVAEAFVERENEHHDTPMYLDGNRRNIQPENVIYRPRWYAVKYMRQFKTPFHSPITKPIVATDSGEVYDNSWEATISLGLLEQEVVFSVLNRTPVWPTWQHFELY